MIDLADWYAANDPTTPFLVHMLAGGLLLACLLGAIIVAVVHSRDSDGRHTGARVLLTILLVAAGVLGGAGLSAWADGLDSGLDRFASHAVDLWDTRRLDCAGLDLKDAARPLTSSGSRAADGAYACSWTDADGNAMSGSLRLEGDCAGLYGDGGAPVPLRKDPLR